MLKRIIAILLGLLLLFSMAGCQKKKQADTPAEEKPTPLIYWNIDGHTYSDPEALTSTRQPAEDGLYHMRFFRDGEVVELTCENEALMKEIDLASLVALYVEDGKITKIAKLNDFYGYHTNIYVQKIDGNKAALASAVLSGMYLEVEINPNTQIYDVSPNAAEYGSPTELGIMDKVAVLYEPDNKAVTHIYISQRPIKTEVLWRVDAVYGQPSWDEEKQCTTRTPDENGVYTIPMAKEGQQVDVLCKDIALVNRIDSLPIGQQAIGLHFDDEGFADDWATPARAILGTLQANQWDVTAIDGDDISTLCNIPSSIQGASDTYRLAADCRIYDTTGFSGPIGIEVDSLRLGDRVMFLCNADREVVIAYITQRAAEN